MSAGGFSEIYVLTALSFFANHRTVRREKVDGLWAYRRIDVEAAA